MMATKRTYFKWQWFGPALSESQRLTVAMTCDWMDVNQLASSRTRGLSTKKALCGRAQEARHGRTRTRGAHHRGRTPCNKAWASDGVRPQAT
jgi:hypothetical protein